MVRMAASFWPGTILSIAMLVWGFEFDSRMRDVVFFESVSDSGFDLVKMFGRNVGDNMQSSAIMIAIHTPNVKVMNIFDILDIKQLMF